MATKPSTPPKSPTSLKSALRRPSLTVPILRRCDSAPLGPIVRFATPDDEENKRRSRRRVSFCKDDSECFEDFTPYGIRYGKHPSDFDFDRNGIMLPAKRTEDAESMEVGTTIECTCLVGVIYRTKPALAAHFDDARTVSFGNRVVVEALCSGWVRDAIGWLPLEIDGKNNFDIVSSAPQSMFPLQRGLRVP